MPEPARPPRVADDDGRPSVGGGAAPDGCCVEELESAPGLWDTSGCQKTPRLYTRPRSRRGTAPTSPPGSATEHPPPFPCPRRPRVPVVCGPHSRLGPRCLRSPGTVTRGRRRRWPRTCHCVCASRSCFETHRVPTRFCSVRVRERPELDRNNGKKSFYVSFSRGKPVRFALASKSVFV